MISEFRNAVYKQNNIIFVGDIMNTLHCVKIVYLIADADKT